MKFVFRTLQEEVCSSEIAEVTHDPKSYLRGCRHMQVAEPEDDRTGRGSTVAGFASRVLYAPTQVLPGAWKSVVPSTAAVIGAVCETSNCSQESAV